MFIRDFRCRQIRGVFWLRRYIGGDWCIIWLKTKWCLSLVAHWFLTLQQTVTHCNTLHHTATHCNTLQHTATHCNTLQHTATYCNTLQHTATHCNTFVRTQTQYPVFPWVLNDYTSEHLDLDNKDIYRYVHQQPSLTKRWLIHMSQDPWLIYSHEVCSSSQQSLIWDSYYICIYVCICICAMHL